MANPEDSIQASIVQFIRTVAPHVRVHAVPNGGLRSKSEAARLKWTGVTAGVPDLCLTIPGGRVAFIEVKAPKGRVTPEQSEFLGWCEDNEIPWTVAKSTEEVGVFLRSLGIKTREAACQP